MQKLWRQCITDNSQICLAIMQLRAFISHLLSSSPVWNSHLWHLVSLFRRQLMFKYSHGHNIVKCLVVFIREKQVGHFWNDCNPRQKRIWIAEKIFFIYGDSIVYYSPYLNLAPKLCWVYSIEPRGPSSLKGQKGREKERKSVIYHGEKSESF